MWCSEPQDYDPRNGLKNDALHVKSPFAGSYTRQTKDSLHYTDMWLQAYSWGNGNVLFFIVMRLIQKGNAEREPSILRWHGTESFSVEYCFHNKCTTHSQKHVEMALCVEKHGKYNMVFYTYFHRAFFTLWFVFVYLFIFIRCFIHILNYASYCVLLGYVSELKT